MAELKAVLDQSGQMTLEDWCFEIGVVAATGEDEAFILDSAASVAAKCEHLRPIVKAEFSERLGVPAISPTRVYDDDLKPRALAEMLRTALIPVAVPAASWPSGAHLASRSRVEASSGTVAGATNNRGRAWRSPGVKSPRTTSLRSTEVGHCYLRTRYR